MSDKQEFYGETVEEAIEKASAAQGVARDQLEFDVLDQGSAGFLGIGARDARIAVKQTRFQSSGLESDSEDQITSSRSEMETPSTRELSGSVQPTEDTQYTPLKAPDELIAAVDEFMTAMVERMGLDATVDAYDAEDVIAVDVATKEAGLFIGQKGETIDAVQYLLNISIYKDRPFIKRIVVDTEGYRQRRIEALQGMAHRAARRALREKRALSLPPMSAAERRVVHLFLKENPAVVTSSEGKEENRKVIITPV